MSSLYISCSGHQDGGDLERTQGHPDLSLAHGQTFGLAFEEVDQTGMPEPSRQREAHFLALAALFLQPHHQPCALLGLFHGCDHGAAGLELWQIQPRWCCRCGRIWGGAMCNR